MVLALNEFHITGCDNPKQLCDLFNNSSYIKEKMLHNNLFGCVYTKEEYTDYVSKNPMNVYIIETSRIGFEINEIFVNPEINLLHITVKPCAPFGDLIRTDLFEKFIVHPRVANLGNANIPKLIPITFDFLYASTF